MGATVPVGWLVVDGFLGFLRYWYTMCTVGGQKEGMAMAYARKLMVNNGRDGARLPAVRLKAWAAQPTLAALEARAVAVEFWAAYLVAFFD